MMRIVSILVAAFAVLVVSAQDDEPAAPRKTWAQIPKSVTSAGGLVKVVAADVPGDPMGFRLPILQFTMRLVRDLERVYKLEMPRGGTGVAIYAMDGKTNDTRVIVRTDRRSGTLCTRIWLPSPGHSDLDRLNFEIASAYFRAWIDRHARSTDGAACGELPGWLVQGAMRAANPDISDEDAWYVLDVWSRARLPFFAKFCATRRIEWGPEAAYSGYLASWLREKHLFKKILERLSAGERWDDGMLAEMLTGTADPVEQDRISDERLARLTRAVLAPGFVSDWDLNVFTSRLLLYPPVFDKNNSANCTSYTFQEAIDLAETNVIVQAAAAQKACEMPFCVLGRGDGLVAAGEAYRQFLLGVARGDKPDVLRPLLATADEKLKVVMERGTNVPQTGKDEN